MVVSLFYPLYYYCYRDWHQSHAPYTGDHFDYVHYPRDDFPSVQFHFSTTDNKYSKEIEKKVIKIN